MSGIGSRFNIDDDDHNNDVNDRGDRKGGQSAAATRRHTGYKSLYALELLSIRNRSKSPPSPPYDKRIMNNNEVDYGHGPSSHSSGIDMKKQLQPQHVNAVELMNKMRSNQSSSPERSPSPPVHRKRRPPASPSRGGNEKSKCRHRGLNRRERSDDSSRSSSCRSSNHSGHDRTNSRSGIQRRGPRSHSGSTSRQSAIPVSRNGKSSCENIIQNRSPDSYYSKNSDDVFRAKLQMLCNVGLIKDNECSQVTKNFVENIWIEFCKLKGAQKMMQSFSKDSRAAAGRRRRRKSRPESSSRSRDSSDSNSSRRSRKSPTKGKKLPVTKETDGPRNKWDQSDTAVSGYKNGAATGERGTGPVMKVTELISLDDKTTTTATGSKRSRLADAVERRSAVVNDSTAAKKVCESLRRQDLQIELLERELEKIEQAIEKQFKPGRDRDEATLEEQIRLGRELKLQIDQVEKERIKLRDKLSASTNQFSRSPLKKFSGSPRKSLAKDVDIENEEDDNEAADEFRQQEVGEEAFEYYDGGDHWCRMCNEASNTIIQFLSHLHTTQHRQRASAYGERPWMKLRDNGDNLHQAQKKSATPFLGSEFVIPVVGFFCKLCMEFTGDIADCEEHLVGDHHNENYRIHLKSNKTYEQKLRLEKCNSSKSMKQEMHSSAAAGKEELDFLQGKIRIGLLNSKGGDQRSPSKSSGAIQSQQKQIEEPDLSDPFYEDAFGLNNLTESELGAHNVKSGGGGGTQQKQSTKSYADRVADGKPNFVVTINRRNEKRSQSGDGRTSKSSDLSYDDDKTFVTTSKLKKFKQVTTTIRDRQLRSNSSEDSKATALKRSRKSTRSTRKRRRSSSRSDSSSRETFRSPRESRTRGARRSPSPRRLRSRERRSRKDSSRRTNRKNGSDHIYRDKYSPREHSGSNDRKRTRISSRSSKDRSRSKSNNGRKLTTVKKEHRSSSKGGRSSSMSLESKDSADEKTVDIKLGALGGFNHNKMANKQQANAAAANFSIKKISLPLTESDQYFTETGTATADKSKIKGGAGSKSFMEIKAEPKLEWKTEDKKESICFSISKEDKLKKQIMETKIFSQIHKSKTLTAKTTGYDSNMSKFKSMTGKKPTVVSGTMTSSSSISGVDELTCSTSSHNSLSFVNTVPQGYSIAGPTPTVGTAMFTNKGFVSTMLPVSYEQPPPPPPPPPQSSMTSRYEQQDETEPPPPGLD